MSASTSRPNGYRCKVGGEWKPWTSFSKKQQNIVQGKLSRRVRIDPGNTGMTCRVHSGEPVKEIQCEGPCDQIRGLDDFSKNSRSNGVYICKFCQHWVNTQEPGYAPWAGPNTQLDPLEEMDDFENRLPTEPSEIFDFHNNNDRPFAPITGTAGLDAADDDELGALSLRLAGLNTSNTGRKITAPCLDNESVVSTRRDTGSIISHSTNMRNLGPNVWFSQAEIARDQTDRRIKYNAWDSNGQQHEIIKSPTVQSGRSSPLTDAIVGGSNSHAKNNTHGKRPASGGPWAGDRTADRRQLSQQEHRELQKNMPQRKQIVPYGDLDDGDDDEDSD
ncbi:hypothetical protein EsH8_II_000813 [Colletotrichum jinshuiense]